jgi:hypothetical protein
MLFSGFLTNHHGAAGDRNPEGASMPPHPLPLPAPLPSPRRGEIFNYARAAAAPSLKATPLYGQQKNSSLAHVRTRPGGGQRHRQRETLQI